MLKNTIAFSFILLLQIGSNYLFDFISSTVGLLRDSRGVRRELIFL